MRSQPPSAWHRILALFLTPFYLLAMAGSFTVSTDSSLPAALMATLAGAAVIIGVLVAFGIKAYRHSGDTIRFNLATVLLFIIPLCVYLAAFRHQLNHFPAEQLNATAWLVLIAGWIVFMLFTTIILIYFAEALMWFLLNLQRWCLRHWRRQ